MNLRRKVLRELAHMTIVPIFLIGLAIYAYEFVISGLMAKPELNFSIIGAFIFALGLAYAGLFGLFGDIAGLDAIRTDHMRRRRPAEGSVFDTPAVVFARPKLLGYGFRLISEELHGGKSKRLPTETVHLLVGEVDQRIAETRATLGYFGGLLILLGLLGAFMGLMKTVHAVSDLIGSMDMTGADGVESFGRMIDGMKAPLNGMSVGFSSSLFGLLFSLSLGLVDRFLINAMKAVRNEFEATLINLAQLDTTEAQNDAYPGGAMVVQSESGSVVFAGGASPDDVRAIRLASDRIHDALTSLNATAASVAQAYRTSRQVDEINSVVQRAFDSLVETQREMAAQMSRFADSAIAAADARSDSEHRVAAALERQIETLQDIAAQNLLARNLATLAHPAATGPANGRQGAIAVHFNGAPDAPAAAASPEPKSRWARLANHLADFLGFETPPAPALASRIPPRPAPRLQDGAILRATESSQTLIREILKRMEEAKREDRRIVRELARRQDAIVTELADLGSQIGAVMRTHDVTPRDRLESLSIQLANLQRAAMQDISRLETQVVATRRTSERAELASQSTAVSVEKLAETAQRRSRA